MQPRVSVIIPVLNEEHVIGETLARTRQAGECELIVVDGGSTDQTVQFSTLADQVVVSPSGRATQLNAGAAAASGDYLFFLHADSRPPLGFDVEIANLLAPSGVAAGCFRQHIDHSGWLYRQVERGNAWRVQLLGWIYGDQGLFLKRELFERLGGFPEMPLMEDLYFSKQLKRAGRLVLSSQTLQVDARRWERRGIIRQTLLNWSFVIMAHCGVSPARLATWYGNVRRKG